MPPTIALAIRLSDGSSADVISSRLRALFCSLLLGDHLDWPLRVSPRKCIRVCVMEPYLCTNGWALCTDVCLVSYKLIIFFSMLRCSASEASFLTLFACAHGSVSHSCHGCLCHRGGY
eukprot:TRINITY_DN78557_c0_g1_i1.p1 TRINITY_DN78557_c0_g1~~TRINITY_DN78557_c0_g1_i1.p1  ORF type:complete len:118 (-),score=7.39 TRINITY_DN78557_c0_g1_i1:44-397(-)